MDDENQNAFMRVFQFIKTVVIGGIVFLVPIVVVVVVVGKAFGLMLGLAKSVDKMIPIETIGGVAMVNVIAVVGILVCCFVAGLIARREFAKVAFRKLEGIMLSFIPGYAFVKGMTDSLASSEKAAEGFAPIIVQFDDYAQLCFEIERTEGGKAVIYLPGAPNPWSGSIVCVTPERVTKLDVPASEAIMVIRKFGRGVIPYDRAAMPQSD